MNWFDITAETLCFVGRRHWPWVVVCITFLALSWTGHDDAAVTIFLITGIVGVLAFIEVSISNQSQSRGKNPR